MEEDLSVWFAIFIVLENQTNIGGKRNQFVETA
jgi:hypothetical protein